MYGFSASEASSCISRKTVKFVNGFFSELGGGNCALLEVQKTVRFKVLFFAQKFYLRTLAKNFSLRESSVFRSKVLLTNFRTFEKCESSEIELLAKNLFFAEKFYLRTLAKKFSLRESSIFHSKVLFANFRTFEKCEISEKELLVKNCFVRFKVVMQAMIWSNFLFRSGPLSSKI